MGQKKRKVIIGGTYKHIHGIKYKVESLLLNATKYELSKTPKKTVLYKQLNAGKFPKGTKWVRTERDFLRKIKVKGKNVDLFEFVKK